MSLRKAGNQLGVNPKYLKGYAEAMGIRLRPAGASLVMTTEDFIRLRKQLKKPTSPIS